jgi:predicted Zn-dependent protease
MIRAWLLPVAVAALLAACRSAPPVPTRAALEPARAEAMVAAIRAAAVADDTEVAVQPLRDPAVEDLREQALRLERSHAYTQAAARLDAALALAPDDPALMQERAEAALLVGDPVAAERLARRAFAVGSKVGPLCRRHWQTIRQVRLLDGDVQGATQAQVAFDACRVAGPDRY